MKQVLYNLGLYIDSKIMGDIKEKIKKEFCNDYIVNENVSNVN